MNDLSGRHALVTGGGSGVGASVALTLAVSGARVTIAGRRAQQLEATAARHSNIRWLQGDVTDSASVEALVRDAAGTYGVIDIVVANAGVAASKPFAKMSEADLRGMLDVNLVGVFNTFHAVLEPMRKAGWGRLIAIASTAGLKGYAYVSGYCAAKHAVVGLTRSLGQELARTGITANAVCPGYTETPMLEETLANIVRLTGKSREDAAAALMADNPQNRFVQPEEVAAAVLWLCSEHSAAMNGQAIAVAGGEL